MPRFFDKYQGVFLAMGKVNIDVLQKMFGVAIGKSVQRANEQCAAVLNGANLGKVAVCFNVNVVEQVGIEPLVGGVGQCRQPAKEFKGQESLSLSVLDLLADVLALVFADGVG